jgi:hypothetical protein
MSRNLMFALLGATLLTPVAFAADQSSNSSATQQAADRDFGKLSTDGMKAFQDIRMARLAIFNGQPDQAKQLVSEASTALETAKTDESVFTKAESELKAPAGMTQPHPSGTSIGSEPIKWLPVDGGIALDENFEPSQHNAATMQKANAQIKSGDKKSAMETLRLANIDLTFDQEVVPLDKTINGIAQARKLVDEGQYYEANQALKTVEDGARFNIESYTDVPGGRHNAASVGQGTDSEKHGLAAHPTSSGD